jgi:hypothetical protein
MLRCGGGWIGDVIKWVDNYAMASLTLQSHGGDTRRYLYTVSHNYIAHFSPTPVT